MVDVYRKLAFFNDDFPLTVLHLTDSAKEFSPEILHIREFWKLTYVVAGHGRFVIGSERFPVGPRSLLLVHPSSMTSWDIDGESLEVYNILFDARLLEDFIQEMADDFHFFQVFSQEFHQAEHIAPYCTTASRQVGALVQKMHWEFTMKRKNWRICLHLQLRLLLLEMLRDDDRRRRRSPAQIVSFVRERMNQCLKERKPFSPQAIASGIGISPCHLSRLYHQVCKVTVSDDFLALRINKAKHLLRETDRPISQISLQAGFPDLRGFYRYFRKATRQTPREFRFSQNSESVK